MGSAVSTHTYQIHEAISLLREVYTKAKIRLDEAKTSTNVGWLPSRYRYTTVTANPRKKKPVFLPRAEPVTILTHKHREAQQQQRARPHDPHEDTMLIEVVLSCKILPAISKMSVDELA